jgi:hypothetical protein
MMFLSKPPFLSSGCSIAMFDYLSVEFFTLRLEFSHFANGKKIKLGRASFTKVVSSLCLVVLQTFSCFFFRAG